MKVYIERTTEGTGNYYKGEVTTYDNIKSIEDEKQTIKLWVSPNYATVIPKKDYRIALVQY